MTYCESVFYKENFSNCTANHGTQKARRFWYRWGNPLDRSARRAMKSDYSNKKRDSRVFVRSELNSISVDMTDEEIDDILIKCFNSETLRVGWCNYY